MGLFNSGYENQSFISDRIPLPVDVITDAGYVNSITGETVQLYYFNSTVPTSDAGQAAGTVVVAKLNYTGVLDRMGAMIGNDKETSLTWTTGTVLPAASIKPCPKFDIEIADNATLYQIATDITANFTSGQWCLDHRSGLIFGKKATTGTSDTAAYKVHSAFTSSGGTSSNVNLNQIGSINVKTDDAAFTPATDKVLPTGFIADEASTDSVDEGDIGIARMTLDRKQITASEAIDDAAFSAGSYLSKVGMLADETTPDSVDEGDLGVPRMTLDRKQINASEYAEDTAAADGGYGTRIFSVQKATPAGTGGSDGDLQDIVSDATGHIYVREKSAAPQAYGIDATGADTFATVVTATAERRHALISLGGSYPAIVSLDGVTEHFYIPANSSHVFDGILIANGATVQGKNGTPGSNYTNLSISIW